MNKATVYISGPMRGYKEFNFPAFISAAQKLREAGYDTLDPAQRDMDDGFNPTGLEGTSEELGDLNFNLYKSLNIDLTWICQEVDAVVVLDDWERSSGATAEVSTAKALGIPIFSLEEALDITTQIEKVVRPS